MLAIYEGGIEAAREEGREEGRKKGKEEGREEGRKELILTMFENGLPVEEISRYTGVALEIVMWLVNKDI